MKKAFFVSFCSLLLAACDTGTTANAPSDSTLVNAPDTATTNIFQDTTSPAGLLPPDNTRAREDSAPPIGDQ